MTSKRFYFEMSKISKNEPPSVKKKEWKNIPQK